MQRALFTEGELEQASERRLKYQGAARVKISDINCNGPESNFLDQKNVERLCNIFRKTRCQRFELANYIPATVSGQALAEAIQAAGISARSLLVSTAKDMPILRFSENQLTALHGRHRLCAGTRVLTPTERWWTVDIYLDGKALARSPYSYTNSKFLLIDISKDLRTSLIEEYSNEKKPTDGEIYRKIRQYESDRNRVLRQKWLIRFSKWKRGRLEQLGKEKNERLRGGFDRLLAIPGLWLDGMRLSMMHRVIALTSVEVSFSFLSISAPTGLQFIYFY